MSYFADVLLLRNLKKTELVTVITSLSVANTLLRSTIYIYCHAQQVYDHVTLETVLVFQFPSSVIVSHIYVWFIGICSGSANRDFPDNGVWMHLLFRFIKQSWVRVKCWSWRRAVTQQTDVGKDQITMADIK